MTVIVAASLLLETKIWPEMKTKMNRDNISKSNEKQTIQTSQKTPSSMKTSKQHKYSNKTDQINGGNWETQFYQNRSIRFGILEFEIHRNAEFEQ